MGEVDKIVIHKKQHGWYQIKYGNSIVNCTSFIAANKIKDNAEAYLNGSTPPHNHTTLKQKARWLIGRD